VALARANGEAHVNGPEAQCHGLWRELGRITSGMRAGPISAADHGRDEVVWSPRHSVRGGMPSRVVPEATLAPR
jgi:hypothetical protein